MMWRTRAATGGGYNNGRTLFAKRVIVTERERGELDRKIGGTERHDWICREWHESVCAGYAGRKWALLVAGIMRRRRMKNRHKTGSTYIKQRELEHIYTERNVWF